jgi:hypothetical protein
VDEDRADDVQRIRLGVEILQVHCLRSELQAALLSLPLRFLHADLALIDGQHI